jgi:hypothetical protein
MHEHPALFGQRQSPHEPYACESRPQLPYEPRSQFAYEPRPQFAYEPRPQFAYEPRPQFYNQHLPFHMNHMYPYIPHQQIGIQVGSEATHPTASGNVLNSYNSVNNSVNLNLPMPTPNLNISEPEARRADSAPMETGGSNRSNVNLENESSLNNGHNGDESGHSDSGRTLKTGGNKIQDEREVRFKAVLRFQRDLDGTWESRTRVYEEVLNNYNVQGYMLAGPIEINIRNPKTVVIIGERESDYMLMGMSDWLRTAFGGQKFKIEVDKILSDAPEIMLIGTTWSSISPNGEEAIKERYGISRIHSKGGNKYELKFKDAKSRDLAMDLGTLATAGVKIKVSSVRLLGSECVRLLSALNVRNMATIKMSVNNV